MKYTAMTIIALATVALGAPAMGGSIKIVRSGASVDAFIDGDKHSLAGSMYDNGILLGDGIGKATPVYRVLLPPPICGGSQITSISVTIEGANAWLSRPQAYIGTPPQGPYSLRASGLHTYSFTGSDARGLLTPVGDELGYTLDVRIDVGGLTGKYDLKEITVTYEYSNVPSAILQRFHEAYSAYRILQKYEAGMADGAWNRDKTSSTVVYRGMQQALALADNLSGVSGNLYDSLKSTIDCIADFQALMDTISFAWDHTYFWIQYDVYGGPTKTSVSTDLRNARDRLKLYAQRMRDYAFDGNISSSDATQLNSAIDAAKGAIEQLRLTMWAVSRWSWEVYRRDDIGTQGGRTAQIMMHSLAPLLKVEYSKSRRASEPSYLTALIDALIHFPVSPDPIPPEPVPPAQDAIGRGIEWLRASWRDEGGGRISWDGDPASTSFAVLTMLNWGYNENDPLVSGGIEYIRSRINRGSGNTYGTVHNLAHRYTYYTSIAILPLAATHNSAYHADISIMAKWLIGSQWKEHSFYGNIKPDHPYYGGWGYGNSTRPDLSNTQFALLGLKAAERALESAPAAYRIDPADTYNKCLIYLDRSRNPDGGSGYLPDGSSASILTMTAASVWSYTLCGHADSDAVRAGVQWLADNYSMTNEDGWGSWSQYYYLLTLSKALTMTHKEKLAGNYWFDDLLANLTAHQLPGGNWPDTGMAGTTMSTVWAILALQTRTLAPGVDTTMWIELRSHADLHVYDPQGRHVGPNYLTGRIDLGIPGATFQILDSEGNEVPYEGYTPGEGLRQVVTLPFLTAGSYRIELVGTSTGPYNLTVKGFQDGREVSTKSFSGDITEGDWLATYATVTAMEGALTVFYGQLGALPVVGVDEAEIKLVAKADSVAEVAIKIREVTGNDVLHSVSLYCTGIVGAEGFIPRENVTFDLDNFDIPPGGEQIVRMTVVIPADFVGPGTGWIVVESADGGTRSIMLTLLTRRERLPYVDPGGPYVGVVGQPITFNAGGSYAPGGGEIVTYVWDWNLDDHLQYVHVPTCQHTWYSAYSGKVRLYLIDDEDMLDWAEADVTVKGPENWLWFVLRSHADLHVYDPMKRHVGTDYKTGLLRKGIPGSSIHVFDTEGQVVPYDSSTPPVGQDQMIGFPLYTVGTYDLRLVGTSDGPFDLEVQGMQDGEIVAHTVYSGDIVQGEVLSLNVVAQYAQGRLSVDCPPLVYPSVVETSPDRIELVVEPGRVYEHQLVIREVRGKTAVTNVRLECAGTMGPLADLPASAITFDVGHFDLPAGGQRVVHVRISVPQVFMGKGQGSIVVKSANGVVANIPVVLKTAGKSLPVAEAGGPYIGVVNEPILFDASGSFDPDGWIVLYGWDWNNDGKIDTYTGSAATENTWTVPFSGTVTLYVFDNDDLVNTSTAQVTVTAAP